MCLYVGICGYMWDCGYMWVYVGILYVGICGYRYVYVGICGYRYVYVGSHRHLIKWISDSFLHNKSSVPNCHHISQTKTQFKIAHLLAKLTVNIS